MISMTEQDIVNVIDWRALKREILHRLPLDRVLSKLNPKDKGAYYVMDCPACGEPQRAFLYKGTGYISCNRRNNCGSNISVFDFLMGDRGCDFKAVFHDLARDTGVSMPSAGASGSGMEVEHSGANLKEDFFHLCKEQLKTDQAKPAREYLCARWSCDMDALLTKEGVAIGFVPAIKVVTEHLRSCGHDESLIQDVMHGHGGDGNAQPKLWTNGFGTTHTIAIPWRDSSGEITGMVTRSINNQIEPKYMYSSFRRGAIPYGLCDRSDSSSIIVVESAMDAVGCRLHGYGNVVASGGSSLTVDQVKSCIDSGVEVFILALDNDKGGKEGTLATINNVNTLARESRGRVSVYVAQYPADTNDAGQLIQQGRIAELGQCFDNVTSSAEWSANWRIQQHDIKTEIGKNHALNDLSDQYTETNSHLDRDRIVTVAADTLNIDREAVEKEFAGISTNRRVVQIENGLIDDLDRIRNAMNIHDIDEATRLASKLGMNRRSEYLRIHASDDESFCTYLEKMIEEDQRRTEGQLGYRLTGHFEKIGDSIDGLQPGFYLLAADTNIGKTAFVSNLIINLLQANEDVRVLYYSLDDSKSIIARRMIAILAEIDINDVSRPSALNNEERARYAEATAKMLKLAREKRLIIKDMSQVEHIDSIEVDVRESAQNGLVVAIDGIYNLQISRSRPNLREENVERANKLKALVDTYRIPLITTGEIRKREDHDRTPELDDLMESSKFAYNASVVWILHPSPGMYYEYTHKDADSLSLYLKKSKVSGPQTKSIVLDIDRAKGIIRDHDSV